MGSSSFCAIKAEGNEFYNFIKKHKETIESVLEDYNCEIKLEDNKVIIVSGVEDITMSGAYTPKSTAELSKSIASFLTEAEIFDKNDLEDYGPEDTDDDFGDGVFDILSELFETPNITNNIEKIKYLTGRIDGSSLKAELLTYSKKDGKHFEKIKLEGEEAYGYYNDFLYDL